MTQASCRNCRFCRVYEHDGRCRRHPPRMEGELRLVHSEREAEHHEKFWAVWPVVNLDGDWCGEFMENTDATGAF